MSWPYPERHRSRTRLLALIGAAVVVVCGGGLALGIALTGDDGGGAAAAPTIEQTRPVVISGDPLPKLTNVGADQQVGKPVPQVEGQSFDGTPVSIKPGRATMLVFFGHWNSNSRFNLEFLADYLREPAAQPDYDIIVVSTQVKPDQPSYPPSDRVKEAGGDPFPFPVLADDEESSVAKAFSFRTFPWIVVYDAAGNLVLRIGIDLDPNFLDVLLPLAFDEAAKAAGA